MKSILGISAFYHDSAAALVIDGEIVAAAQEERFTRKKHDQSFPANAIAYCLEEAELSPDRLDHVVFYEKPLLKFERILETYLAVAPLGFRSFLQALPLWIHHKLHLQREINRGLQNAYRRPYIFTEHHESHASSAFYPSPFHDAAILTLDGVGEWATATLGFGAGNRVRISHELHFPHSLGLLYSAFTYYCGFRVNSGEYKLMGLAPYGVPRYAELILEKLLDLKDDGSLRLDLSYFNYCQGLTMTSRKFHTLFEGPPRRPETPITAREMDLAASIQKVTELVMLKMACHLHRLTGCPRLCLAGGVALNCVGNGRLLRESPFDDLWIQPASGDAGGALGAALFVWYQLLDNKRVPQQPDGQRGSLLGPSYAGEEIIGVLDRHNASYQHIAGESELCEHVADLVSQGKVVGWMQGRMEFGPRALGNRSILGDARNPEMQATLNLKIKYRESFRPFAPIVLREHASEYFALPETVESPYMLLVAPIRSGKALPGSGETRQGFERLREPRSVVPAVTHVDNSVRIQTVDKVRNPRLYGLLQAFERRAACPLMINTSFNVRGEPIVCSPEDAYRCFMATEMDALVIGEFVLHKEQQNSGSILPAAEYVRAFDPD